MRGPHPLFHRRKLTPCFNNSGHVKLILEVCRGHMERLGHSCHGVSFLEISGQGFLANDSLDPGSVLDGLGYGTHDVEADGIRGENADHVNGGTHIGDVTEYPGVAQAVLACPFCKGLCALRGTNAGQFGAADRTQRPLMKPGYKTGSDHPYSQH
jgi:hypothetical protein